ncbi:hypothetical protein [Lysobacter gummosus]|uniref:hypothetical protein n=1 Tax=Lysobacter gummosus TaxID=262324 RepID=UPI00363BD7AB
MPRVVSSIIAITCAPGEPTQSADCRGLSCGRASAPMLFFQIAGPDRTASGLKPPRKNAN